MNEQLRSVGDAAPLKTRIDPITASVIQGALENIAVEMGYKLMRMSYSSIIRESEDFGAALTDAEGQQLCECKLSTPLQSGPIPGYIRGIRKTMKARGEEILPGDVIMHNDPYGGASHGPDVAFAVPVFRQDRLIGFSVTTAHHLDIGALTPGSCGIVDAVDTYAEGLQFKAIKIIDAGRRNSAVWNMLRDNIRAPDLVVGDMEAQIKAAEIGAERYVALVEQYGLDTVTAACEDLMDYSERLMRAAISNLPDGSYTRRRHYRRLSRRSRCGPSRPQDRRHCHGQGGRDHGRPDRHRAAGLGQADQHAARGHGRCRDLADASLDPARQHHLWQHPAEQRADSPDHHHRAARHARQPDLPGAGHCPLLPREPARRHGDEGAVRRGAEAGQCRHRQSSRRCLLGPE